MNNRSDVTIKGVTTVIHTATASPGAPAHILQKVNVEGTKILLEACKLNNVKQLIYTSSASVVFVGKELKNVDESIPYPKKFIDGYNESKVLILRPTRINNIVCRPLLNNLF